MKRCRGDPRVARFHFTTENTEDIESFVHHKGRKSG